MHCNGGNGGNGSNECTVTALAALKELPLEPRCAGVRRCLPPHTPAAPRRPTPRRPTLQVKEIHAEARMQLPSISLERASSDEDDEPPIMTARFGNPTPR